MLNDTGLADEIYCLFVQAVIGFQLELEAFFKKNINRIVLHVLPSNDLPIES